MKNVSKYLYGLISFSIVLTIWFLVTAFGLVRPFFLPAPVTILHAIVELFIQSNLLHDVVVSTLRIIVGFGVAAICAIPLGILMYMYPILNKLIEPFNNFIRYTPVPAYIPLFVLWFGIGELEKFVVIFSTVFVQLLVMVVGSVNRTPISIIESAKILGASKMVIIKDIIFQYAKPYLLNDLRVCMGFAWSGLIIAEIVGAKSGLGLVVVQAQRLLQTANVIGVIVVIGVLGVVTDFIFSTIDKRYSVWK